MAVARSYKCPICSTHWPIEQRYRTCPECDNTTWGAVEEPIERYEAQQRFMVALHETQKELAVRRKAELFDTYYIERQVEEFNAGLDEYLATILGAPTTEK